ncbi:MAG: hypothetical protein KIS92_19150 [Planctomycetota bacterium]|nr:hypothetical protein [Planctomycetota bacterium]
MPARTPAFQFTVLELFLVVMLIGLRSAAILCLFDTHSPSAVFATSVIFTCFTALPVIREEDRRELTRPWILLLYFMWPELLLCSIILFCLLLYAVLCVLLAGLELAGVARGRP